MRGVAATTGISSAAFASRFVIGLVFGVGLWVSGMTDPAKVSGFLDITGAWDPSLMFVMASALAVTFVGYRVVGSRPRPILEPDFDLPAARGVDAPLLGGAALFGVGWGIAGYCPGPAVTSLFVSPQAVLFTGAMITGMIAARFRFGLHRIRSGG